MVARMEASSVHGHTSAEQMVSGGYVQTVPYMGAGMASYWHMVDVPMVYVFLVLDSTDDLAAGNFESIGAAETLHSAQSLPF